MNYFSLAPEYRAYNLDRLVFSATTAFEEDYILPLSYKEFVYGKRSLLEKVSPAWRPRRWRVSAVSSAL